MHKGIREHLHGTSQSIVSSGIDEFIYFFYVVIWINVYLKATIVSNRYGNEEYAL
jgi:hypothetical protein